MFSISRLTTVLVAVATLCSELAAGRQMRKRDIQARQREAAKRWQATGPVRRAAPKNITFSNPRASGMTNLSCLKFSH